MRGREKVWNMKVSHNMVNIHAQSKTVNIKGTQKQQTLDFIGSFIKEVTKMCYCSKSRSDFSERNDVLI